MLTNLPPPISFHFLVVFYGTGSLPIPNPIDIRFQKVSGIELTMDSIENRRIGGKQVRLPNFPQHNNLILERGYALGISPLKIEMHQKFENLQFKPRNVHVFLLNPQSIPIASWLFFDAFPIRWSLSDLDASQSSVLIETIELSYSRVQKLSL